MPQSPVTDILFVAHNRFEFTRASFRTLLDNTEWDAVRRLVIHDDASTDGTAEYLKEAAKAVPADVYFESARLGSPVAAMNRYLERSTAEWFAKIDNDTILPPGWLSDLLGAGVGSGFDLIGAEPRMGLPEGQLPDATRVEAQDGYSVTRADYIGGVGLMRVAPFYGMPLEVDGTYFGFTAWQERNDAVTSGWITPDLRLFHLDLLGFEPWASLTDEYVAEGWQRKWPPYHPDAGGYWDWWRATL